MDKQPEQPKMHPNPPPVKKGDSGGYQPPPPDPKGDLEAVAALMAGTAMQTKEIGSNIVDAPGSAQIQQFDAHTALKKHMDVTGTAPQTQPMQQIQPVQPVQQVQQVQQVPAQVYAQPAPVYDDGQVLRRLLSIEDKLNNLEVVFEKILRGVLRKNAKQLTIRFDDTNNSKSK